MMMMMFRFQLMLLLAHNSLINMNNRLIRVDFMRLQDTFNKNYIQGDKCEFDELRDINAKLSRKVDELQDINTNWAVHGATELRVFTVVAFCAAWNGGGVL